MAISKRRITLMAISLFAFVGLSQIVLESFVDARAGGGRSGGFRGSRSYQSPSKPTQPSQPRRDAAPPAQQPSPFGSQSGGFMRTFGTAMLGGFLGSMLFSGLAHGGGFGGLGGLGSSGIGLVEILLFAGLGYFLYRKFLRPAAATGYGTTQYQNTRDYSPQYTPVQEAPAINNDIDYRSLTMMDRSFDPNQFLKTAQDTLFQSSGRVEQAGYGRFAFLMWIRVDANMGAGAERPKGSRSPEQDGKYRPPGKRDYRSLDGKRPRLYYDSPPRQSARLHRRSKKRQPGQRQQFRSD